MRSIRWSLVFIIVVSLIGLGGYAASNPFDFLNQPSPWELAKQREAQQAAAYTDQVMVGKTRINVPAPKGYVKVTPAMTAAHRIHMQQIAPGSLVSVLYIAEDQVSASLAGKEPDLTRSFHLQIVPSQEDSYYSVSEFASYKRIVKESMREVIESVEKEFAGLDVGSWSQNLNKLRAVLDSIDLVPLAFHEETATFLAQSLFLRMEARTRSGQSTVAVKVFTRGFLLTNKKIVYLYAHAEETGLDWSRSACKSWATSIANANLETRN